MENEERIRDLCLEIGGAPTGKGPYKNGIFQPHWESLREIAAKVVACEILRGGSMMDKSDLMRAVLHRALEITKPKREVRSVDISSPGPGSWKTSIWFKDSGGATQNDTYHDTLRYALEAALLAATGDAPSQGEAALKAAEQ